MTASINDKFSKVISGTTRPVATTLAAQKLSGATSCTVVATTGWDTGTAVHGIMYRTDSAGEKVAGSQIDWKGTISGTTISSFTVTAGSDDTYAIGTTVELSPTAAWGDDLVTGILVEHAQDGTHVMARPKVTTSIDDTNGNELIKVTATASAVNEVTVTNAATGNAPTISATGGDATANLNINSKGTGSRVVLNGAGAPLTATTAASSTTTSTSYTNLADGVDTSVTATIGTSGMALVSIAANGANNGADGTTSISFAVSGATTIAASTTRHTVSQRLTTATAGVRYSHTVLIDGLTAGSNVFTLKYLVAAGTGTFSSRTISVVPL